MYKPIDAANELKERTRAVHLRTEQVVSAGRLLKAPFDVDHYKRMVKAHCEAWLPLKPVLYPLGFGDDILAALELEYGLRRV